MQPPNPNVYFYGLHTPVPYQYVNGQVVYMVFDRGSGTWKLPPKLRKGN